MATTNRTTEPKRTLQKAAQAVGAVFLLVGILGLIPGITSNYDTLSFARHDSEALLLGIIQVSVLHNIVHLLFGVAGILRSRSNDQARNFLLYGGVIYLVLRLYGLIIGHDTPANFVPVNTANNWLHFVLGIAMIALAILLSRNQPHPRWNQPITPDWNRVQASGIPTGARGLAPASGKSAERRKAA
jgi:arginine exporter protein ArgO